ncbi:MAG: hypothetical protein V3W18_04360 [candidate division Zixibacteria bacterium]
MMIYKRGHIDAVYLGICSIATQTVFLRFILSSPNGGEFYASLALGGWIVWVGLGALIGSKLDKSFKERLWGWLAIVKLPLALLIFVYPSFFTGILDPFRFLPLAFLGMLPQGFLYGLMFAVLVKPGMKATRVYRNEAIGSVLGGLLATLWLLGGGADFGLLALISALEFSRCFKNYIGLAVTAAGIIFGIYAGPRLDQLASQLRWSEFKVERIAIGSSGRWTLISSGDQTTIVHNGNQVSSIPDRASSEEALLWPFLYHLFAKDILLIGYEGISVDKYLPAGIDPASIDHLSLYSDEAFARLGKNADVDYKIADPLRYSSEKQFDIVSLNLHGCADLIEYRKETALFIERLRGFLKNDGVLFVSAPSDENYISPRLGEYLAPLYNTLKASFDSVTVIPGAKAGFVCRDQRFMKFEMNPELNLQVLGIESPYFNTPMIENRLLPYRVSNFMNSLGDDEAINEIGKPHAVYRFMKWQSAAFGRSGLFFDLYSYPFILISPLLIIPFIISKLKSVPVPAVLGVTLFGFAGMALEITSLYLFSTLFGSLYLHIGLLIALFMAGLALGATVIHRINRYFLVLINIGAALVLGAAFGLSGSFLSLKVSYVLLYMISLFAGFAAGGGYAVFANRCNGDNSFGATLYGADLYGALTAAVAVPGILMISGLGVVMILVGAVSLIIAATFFGR